VEAAPLPPPPPTSEPSPSKAPSAFRGYGKLVVKGAATYTRVYYDGKLLLGQGPRSFRVFCGPHTVALGEREAVREVEVPCNGQLVVAK
jgi:hypothetical protein